MDSSGRVCSDFTASCFLVIGRRVDIFALVYLNWDSGFARGTIDYPNRPTFFMSNVSNFSDQFQRYFQSMFWKSVRELQSETIRPSMQTVAILRAISQAGPSTVGELSLTLDRAQSTVSEIVDRLAASKLVDRMPDSDDLRRNLIWLTLTGRTELENATTPLDPSKVESLSKNLTAEERAELLRIFQKLVGGSDV